MTHAALSEPRPTGKTAISRLLDFKNDTHEIHFALEERFAETIGLARALEATSTDPCAKAIVALVRRDYERLIDAFRELDEKHDVG